MAEITKDKDTSAKQTAGAVGGAMVGATVGNQLANAIKDLLKAKGLYRKHPYILAPLGAAMNIGGAIGGITTGAKVTARKSEKERLPVELSITPTELESLVKKHKGIHKVAKLWYPLVTN